MLSLLLNSIVERVICMVWALAVLLIGFTWIVWKAAIAIAVFLVGLWIVGMLTAVTLGGLIHLLLVVAIIAVLIRIIRGQRIL